MQFALWEQVLLAVLVLASAGLFFRGLAPRLRVIRKGRSDRIRTDDIPRRLATTFKEVLFQTRVIGGRPVAGAMHAAVFGGFLFFALETANHFLEPYGLHLLRWLFGDLTPAYRDIVAVWAVLVLVGIVGLALRRFVFVRFSPDPTSYGSGFVALLIVVLMVTFLYGRTDPTPLLAKLNWWSHAVVILVFPHLILRSKHFHIIMAPINIFFRTERLADILPLDLDLEAMEDTDEEPSFGLENLGNLSWKERMDFLTCVECRRCTDSCPANLAGQELDPRAFVLAGREAIMELEDDASVIGPVLSEKALGQCTSCAACEAVCPVGIEHLQILTGAKRAQALALGTGMVASEFLTAVERSGNPFSEPVDARARLIEELGIPIFEPGASEYLLWLGCVWSYNQDARAAVEAMIQILAAAEVSYGVLPEESCSGHHSRRQGEELQFQTLAQENIERFKEAGVTKMISPCPHCLHTIGREYPALDDELDLDVVHHSELIGDLLASGALTVDEGRHREVVATYHDPCYLGRYEEVYDDPRRAVARTGLRIIEMERHRQRAVCCGGGSAGFAREPDDEVRVDQVRKGHVEDTGARLLVTGCPECKMMLDAAVDETKDLAQVVAEALI